MHEKSSKSFESQLQMARPKRAEVKRVPLTPEEKEFLRKIMDKAVAAEKAGDLQQALNLYTDYKNELLKIKEEKEKKEKEEKEERGGIKWTKEKLENWIASIGIAEEDFVEQYFDLSKLPKLESKGSLDFSNLMIDMFPADMKVKGTLTLSKSVFRKGFGSGLIVKGDLIMNRSAISHLPNNIKIDGKLILRNSTVQDLPDDIYIGSDIWVGNCKEKVIEKAGRLKAEGKIKGDVKY